MLVQQGASSGIYTHHYKTLLGLRSVSIIKRSPFISQLLMSVDVERPWSGRADGLHGRVHLLGR